MRRERAAPELSVLFVNHESWEELAGALVSLRRHAPPCEFEVVVVDNGSRSTAGRARALELLGELDGLLLARADNPGYGAGMNHALRAARAPLLLVCNPDLVFLPGAIAALVQHLAAHARVGVVAPEVYLDRACSVRAPAHVLPTPRDLVSAALAAVSVRWNRRYSRARTRAAVREWTRREPFEQAMFGGCCFLVRRELVERIGFFDERYPLYFEDTDLARRVRAAGHAIVQVPGARVVHLYGRSSRHAPERAAAAYRTSRRRYFERWYGRVGGALCALVERFAASSFARRRVARLLAAEVAELAGAELELPRACERFAIELCTDPLFLLAGGAFGSGARWRLDPQLLAELRQPVWLRALALEDGQERELGRWRHAPRPLPPFDRILRSFGDERALPAYAAERAALDALVAELRAAGLGLRLDHGREWEYAHVLQALARLPALEHVLDLGGGNGPLAYLLARRGAHVTMLDADPEAVARTRDNARRLGLAHLTSVHARGAWPLASRSMDAIACVSVIEGVLRKDRALFWSEIRRVLRPAGALFLTFDYGPDARFVGDAPFTLADVERDLVRASGLARVGAPLVEPDFGAAGPPLRAEALEADGTRRAIAYTFGALELQKLA